MKSKHPILYIFILVILLVPSIFIVEGLSQMALNTILPYKSGITDILNSIIFMFISMLGGFGLIAIYRKYIDKESFFDMGFSFKNRLFDLLLGIATGVVLISIGFIFLIAIGNLEVTGIDFNVKWFFGSMVLMILVSLHEEVIVRGYLLNSLMSISNKYFALALSSILFGAMHLMNPNISTVSFINIVLAGFLLGISYLHSKNLWFPMGLHFSWNFFQGPVLGFEVSGQEMKSLISQNISGNELITGGEFGFEGSLIATVLMIV
ncbi:MAG: CPBP family intramembrane metalloprotease, partial [Flavobacteriales bacterium]|nr:CPBP family intramembrane metalloprotease [Flavobacteriales bacterium]